MIALANLGIAAALAVVALGLQFQTVLLGQIAIGAIAVVNAADLILARLPSRALVPSVSPFFQSRRVEFGTLAIALGLALFCALSGSGT